MRGKLMTLGLLGSGLLAGRTAGAAKVAAILGLEANSAGSIKLGKRTVRNYILGVASTLLLSVPLTAGALTITVTGSSDPNGIPISGTAVFSFLQGGAGNVVYLDMVVTNNNTSASASALGGVLFAFDPDLPLSIGSPTFDRDPDNNGSLSVFQDVVTATNGDGGYLFDIDFCAMSKGNAKNCNGVGPNGLAEGVTDNKFRFIMTFDNPFSAQTLEDWMSGALSGDGKTFGLCMRWQAVNGTNPNTGSAVRGDSAKGCVMGYVPPDEKVPEPGTLALLGVGLLGLGLSRQRRNP